MSVVEMSPAAKISNFLEESGVFFVATVFENLPKCRPFSLQMLIDDQVYFAVGSFKEACAQMQINPNVEICAYNQQGFLRYWGKAEFVDDPNLEEEALKRNPELHKIYNKDSGANLRVFRLSDSVCEFRKGLDLVERFEIK